MVSIFSRRAAAAKGPDAYKYDELPAQLRNKIIHICNGVVGKFPAVYFHGGDAFYSGVRKAILQQLGLLRLVDARTAEEDIWNFFLQQPRIETCLDLIEIIFACLVAAVQGDSYVNGSVGHDIRQAVDQINTGFQEHSIGYEFREGRFIRIDTGFLHKEIVNPAMALLRETYLSGANEEFLKAHDHFRHRRFGECINECLKAFESTMKAICHEHAWSFDSQKDTASKLLTICHTNGLFPPFMQNSLSGLRSVLEGVATIRNRLSAHGQGVQPIQITEEVAAFVLHSTAANILFLASLEKKLP